MYYSTYWQLPLLQNGRMKHEDVKEIWKDYPAELHDWLLHLTEVFDLTFPLPDTEESIVPCLLPQKEPKVYLANSAEGCGIFLTIFSFSL